MKETYLTTKNTKYLLQTLKAILEEFVEIENYVIVNTKEKINDLVLDRTKGRKTHKHVIQKRKCYGIDLFFNGKNYIFITEYDNVESLNDDISTSTLVVEVKYEPFKINSVIYLEAWSKTKYITADINKVNEYIKSK